MADLNRSGLPDVVAKHGELRRQRSLIMIEEKKAQLRSIANSIEYIQNVELKKALHQQAILGKQLEELEEEYRKTYIDDKKQGGK